MEIKEFKYSANYCEENIWHLCQNPELERFSKKVFIVSNSNRNCQFRFQKSTHGNEFVWWNYHVILFASKADSSLIYDFDSTLPVPLSGKEYLQKTFLSNENWKEKDLPAFKLIDANDFINSFVSDRSHMIDAEGNWLSSPPKWPLIGKDGGVLSLPALLDFTLTSNERIYSLEEVLGLLEKFEPEID